MTIYVNLELDHGAWVLLPPFWGGASWRDAREWSDEVAKGCWTDSGLPHTTPDIEHLSALLGQCAHKWGPGSIHPEHEADPGLEVTTVLHLPNPSMIPMPVRVLVANADVLGDPMPSLGALAIAEDSEAITPPEVGEVHNPNLGTGVRVFRHRPLIDDGESGGAEPLYALLRYAFPVPDHRDVVLVEAAWPDLGRIAGAREDIDHLVATMSWEYQPEPPAEVSADA